MLLIRLTRMYDCKFNSSLGKCLPILLNFVYLIKCNIFLTLLFGRELLYEKYKQRCGKSYDMLRSKICINEFINHIWYLKYFLKFLLYLLLKNFEQYLLLYQELKCTCAKILQTIVNFYTLTESKQVISKRPTLMVEIVGESHFTTLRKFKKSGLLCIAFIEVLRVQIQLKVNIISYKDY